MPQLLCWFALLGCDAPAIAPPAAPADLQALIDAGQVRIEYVADPEFVERNRGNCHFALTFRRKFQYRCKTSRQAGKPTVTVTVTSITPDVSIQHDIRLPESYFQPNRWTTRLMRHEFDHVAVSIDPRPVLLLTHLVRHLPPIRHELQADETADAELYARLINTELDRREDAVTEVMSQNYRLLDEVSRHGTVPIPNRAEFFARLYSKERLAELQFPYMDAALAVLETEAYRDAELLYLKRDPTER